VSGSFNSFYHLHTPKTGGHWVDSLILRTIKPALEDAGIPFKTDHAGWSHVQNNTYILSTWRDPALRTVSHFCHYKNYFCGDSSKSSEAELLNWVEKNEGALSNYQSRTLLYSTQETRVPYFYLNHKDFLNTPIDRDEVLKRLSRINVIIKDIEMDDQTAESVLKKIVEDLKLKHVPHPIKGTDFNINPNSQELFNILSSSTIDYLFAINPLDTEIYLSDNSSYWFARER
jgi:hypothetical protein